MKSLLILVFSCLLFLLTACKKSSQQTSEVAGKYFFKCSVDSFYIDEKVRYDYMNRITLKSYRQNTNTYFQVSGSPAGIPYISGDFLIVNAAEGEFFAHDFQLTVGKDINSETTYSDSKTNELIKVVIDKYEFGTYDKPGIIAGSFSGVVTNSENPDPSKTFPINGSFAFPAR